MFSIYNTYSIAIIIVIVVYRVAVQMTQKEMLLKSDRKPPPPTEKPPHESFIWVKYRKILSNRKFRNKSFAANNKTNSTLQL